MSEMHSGSWKLVLVNDATLHVCGQGTEQLHCHFQPVYTQRTVWPQEIEDTDVVWCENCKSAYFDRELAYTESIKPRRKS